MKIFRLKFQTSQTTNLATSVIVNRVLEKLKEKKYEIREATHNHVIFGRDPFQLVWSHKAIYLLDGGDFKIFESENETVVVLSYFINVFYSLLIFTSLIISIIIEGQYYGVLFFGIFFFIAGIDQFFTTKHTGKNLLSNVIENN